MSGTLSLLLSTPDFGASTDLSPSLRCTFAVFAVSIILMVLAVVIAAAAGMA